MEMTEKPAYRAQLLQEEGASSCQRPERRCKKGHRACFGFLVGLALVAMAIMFVGGWFAGRKYEKDALTGQSQHHHSNNRYYTMQGDGSTLNMPAIQGNVPVTDFIQCSSVEGTDQCMSGNPMLTPKGTLQLTVYEYNGQPSLIITGTGPDYGNDVTATRSKRAAPAMFRNTLHFSNCEGNSFTPTSNDYNQFNNMVHIPSSGISRQFNYSDLSAFTHVITNLGPQLPADGCQLWFDNNQHNFTVRGGADSSTFDFGHVPSASSPLRFRPFEGTQLPSDSDDTEFQSPISSMPQHIQFPDQFTDVTPNLDTFGFARKRRSVTTERHSQPGAMYQTFDPETRRPMNTIRIMHDMRHGGQNGTITYDVTNHQNKCRSRLTMLYHDKLSNGREMMNVTHHQTFLFSHRSSGQPRNLSMWQSVTPFGNEITSTARSMIGKIPNGDLPCFTGEMRDLNTRMQNAKTSHSSSQRARRSLSWNCGWGESLSRGAECGYHGYECGSDIAEGDVTFGLTLFKAAKDCWDAGDSCYGLVHNCVGGL